MAWCPHEDPYTESTISDYQILQVSRLWSFFKARLVAGGKQQDKGLYDDLSSPTVATSSVLAVAAIAAAEGCKVVAIDIGGAFLNADMSPAGIDVHMRLDRVMSSMLIQLDPSYETS